MEITEKKNIEIKGNHGLPILADVYYKNDKIAKPVVIFVHGYKGFKDWGAWNLMAKRFAEKGYFFVKFNFSHNGTTPEFPEEFKDIEAFGENNFIKELDDLKTVIDWILYPEFDYATNMDAENVNLIGHSRGGGIVIIKAEEEPRIKKTVSFSAVSNFGERFPKGETLEKWKEKGVSYIENSRTKQKLPHHFQFYTNFKENEERLTISRAAKSLQKPLLIVHGSSDTSVSMSASGDLFEWAKYAELLLVENADHVYGVSHPWKKDELPKEFEYALDKTFKFLETSNKKLKAETKKK